MDEENKEEGFKKAMPDDAQITIEIIHKDTGLHSKAQLTGEMVNVIRQHQHICGIEEVFEEMINQINYKEDEEQ